MNRSASRVGSRMSGCRGASGIVTMMMIVVPCFVLINVIMIAGQYHDNAADLESAAREGARVASLANSEGAARAAADAAAMGVIADNALPCTNATLSFSVTDWGPGGQVTVGVICDLTLVDFGFGDPIGSTHRTGRFSTEVLDPYREYE